jgi:hypothetical protein
MDFRTTRRCIAGVIGAVVVAVGLVAQAAPALAQSGDPIKIGTPRAACLAARSSW